jgi:peptidoglycan/LPS O-acetylase OafA/YrhL
MPSEGRLNEIDWLKAAAILTVVLIHSVRAEWDPGFRYAERLVSEIARFAVPAFLAVSGFLYYSSTPIPAEVLWRRLRRILFPYFWVSLAAYAYVQVFPQFAPTSSFLAGMLLGATFGPYYYVFLLTEFVLATYLLSRMPRGWIVPVFATTCAAAVLPFLVFAEGVKVTLWTLRLPLLFGCWFMLGWTAAAYPDARRKLTTNRRRLVFAAWGAVGAAWLLLDLGAVLPPRLSRVSSLFLIGANIIGLYTVFRAWGRRSRVVIALSERTYAIYLLHLFFVYSVIAWFGGTREQHLVSSTLASWVAGVGGALLVIALVRSIAPRWSRDLIGY